MELILHDLFLNISWKSLAEVASATLRLSNAHSTSELQAPQYKNVC